MSVKFGVSIMTIYRKYLPNLEPLFKEKTVIYYDWQKQKNFMRALIVSLKLQSYRLIPNIMESKVKPEVYTIEATLKYLGISRTTFERYAKQHLTQLELDKGRRFWLCDEVHEMKIQMKKVKSEKYNVIA